MIKIINDLPPHVAGLHAFGEVTREEYEKALLPLLSNLRKTTGGRINLILVLESNIKNFASGKWCGNVKIGLKYFFKWNRLVIVSDEKDMSGFSDFFKYLIPGKYESFPLDQLEIAVRWVSVKCAKPGI